MTVAALAAGCYGGAGAQATLSLIHREPWDWTEMLVSGWTPALVAVMVAGLLRSGLFLSGDERAGRAMIRTALATGELPPDARPEAWRKFLAQEAKELRQVRWILAALMLPIAGVVAAAAVVVNDNDVRLWALAVVLAGCGVVVHRWLHRRLNRAEHLLARLDRP